MLTIKRFVCNFLEENCYVVSDDSGECIIIDCGAYFQEEKDAMLHYICDNKLKPVHLVATHGHLDHNFGNMAVYRAFGLAVEVCAEDELLAAHLSDQSRDILGVELNEEQPPVGRLLKQDDTITFGQHTLRVLQTPGHTHGSVFLYCAEEQLVFSGDTLFRMSIGRTDFAEGSWEEMAHSLHHVVAKLPPDTVVLSGHGPQTTIAEELVHNPYLR